MLLFAMPASIAAQLIISFHDISTEQPTTFLLSTSSPVLSQLLPRLDLETAIRDVRPSSPQVFGSSNARRDPGEPFDRPDSNDSDPGGRRERDRSSTTKDAR